MDKMTFTTDRTSLTEGEVIEINWNCSDADRVELSIDNGYKATALPLENSGTKRFRLNRSKGKTHLTMTAWVAGKSYSKTIKVAVKEIPVTRAEAVDQKGNPMGRLGEWWNQRVLPKWQAMRTGRNAAWQAMPPNKRMAARLLIILGLLGLVSVIAPWLFSLGLLGLMIYLAWVLLKK